VAWFFPLNRELLREGFSKCLNTDHNVFKVTGKLIFCDCNLCFINNNICLLKKNRETNLFILTQRN
jgi:hypothetical protein